MKDKIPSLTDKEWSEKNELGKIERVLEYRTADGIQCVNVTANLISGVEIEAIEADCASVDMDVLDEKGEHEIEIDTDRFAMLRMCKVFNINEDTYNDIMQNKPEGLRNQMILLVAELSGTGLSAKEIDKEKN